MFLRKGLGKFCHPLRWLFFFCSHNFNFIVQEKLSIELNPISENRSLNSRQLLSLIKYTFPANFFTNLYGEGGQGLIRRAEQSPVPLSVYPPVCYSISPRMHSISSSEKPLISIINFLSMPFLSSCSTILRLSSILPSFIPCSIPSALPSIRPFFKKYFSLEILSRRHFSLCRYCCRAFSSSAASLIKTIYCSRLLSLLTSSTSPSLINSR